MAITIKYTYDYMDHRATKKETDNGETTLHHPPPQTLYAMARRACLPSQSGNTAEESDRLRDLMGIAMGLRAFYFERWKKNINSYEKDCQYEIK